MGAHARRLPVPMLLAGLVLASCAGTGTDPGASTAWFDRMQREIFNVSCLSAGCHNASDRAGNMVLAEGSSYAALVVNSTPDNPAAQAAGLSRVVPFDPAGSFLLIKVTQPGEGQGSRMPLNASALSPAQIDIITNWITEGAVGPTGTPGVPSLTPTPSPSPTVPPQPTETPAPPATQTTQQPTVTPAPTGLAASPTATPTPTATATGMGVSLAEIQQLVFSPICATQFCHSASVHSGNLVLEAGQSFDALVDVVPDNATARNAGLVRVRPGDPAASFLVIKLAGPRSGEADRMPLAQLPLPAEQIELIRQWIEQGAVEGDG